MDCNHRHGANLKKLGVWVCGQCYEKLRDRPKRYTMKPLETSGADGPGYRQEIAWMAEIRKSSDGTNLEQFIYAMARRLMRASKMSEVDAIDYAIDILRVQFDYAEFGDPDYCWDRQSAIDMVDEDVQYWDHEEADSN